MTLFVAWVVFPVVLAAVSLGCGLLVQQAVGRPLPGLLLIPIGFATIVVAASLTTMSATTASFTTPLVLALAIAGFGLSLGFRPRPDGWAVAAAVGVFAVYAAPIVLSGSATFAGYITLDDTSTWLALADNALVNGRSLSGLAPSTYSTVLNDYLSHGYPLGAFLPLGVGHQLTGRDSIWLFQPQIAFVASLLSLSAYALTAGLIRSRVLRALVALVGSAPALLYGYAFWSGIKEVTVAALIALTAALAASATTRPQRVREVVPLAVAAAAVLVCLSVAGMVWLGAVAVFGVFLLWSNGLRRSAGALVALAALGLALSIPALTIARAFLDGASQEITAGTALGNLFHPLSYLQVFGIWPTADFRGRPTDMGPTYVLLALVALAAVVAVVAGVRRQAWGVPFYALAGGGGCLLVIALGKLGHGSPWVNGKALATASPAFVVAALAGAAVVFESGRRVEAVLAAMAIAAGVGWSDALTYGNVWLAPAGQITELESIGKQYAGEGPTLMTEYQSYGARHLLRNLDPEAASERRARPIFLRTGGEVDKGQYADIDAFQLADVLVYRTLVLRTSPLASRPPSAYRLVSRGRFYEVWQRPEPAAPVILEHLPLGDETQPVAVPSCADVRRLGALAAAQNGMLVAARRPEAVTVALAQAALPPGWQTSGETIVPSGAGTASDTVAVPRAGVYGFWVGGSFRDRLTISVDGAEVGSVRDHLNEAGQLVPFGAARLAAGSHRIELHYDGPGLRPGSRSYQFGFGPLVLGAPAADAGLVQVAPAESASLCGKKLDWVEAVSG